MAFAGVWSMRKDSRRFVVGTGLEIEVAGPVAVAAAPWALITVSPEAVAGTAPVDAAIAINLSTAQVRTLLDNSPMAESLLANKSSTGDCIITLRITNAPLVRRVAEQLWQVAYEDTALRLFLQGKVIELLIEGMSSPKEGQDLTLAAAVRDLLLAAPGHPPSVTELPARLGVSRRRLGAEFKAAFGMSIPEWQAEGRLVRGRELVAETSVPMAEIAASLGYAHLSTFTAAFAKRFGQPPSRLRSQQAQEGMP